MEVTDGNLAQGAILSQFFIITILFVGGILLRRRFDFGNWNRGVISHEGIGWLTLALAVVSIGSLILSDAVANSWGVLFKDLGYSGLPWRHALRFCFFLNAIVVCALVSWTGGSIDSPFQPIWFLIPTLSLFLREPTIWVVTQALLSISFFCVWVVYQPTYDSDRPGKRRSKIAICTVTALCLFASTFIGIYTR